MTDRHASNRPHWNGLPFRLLFRSNEHGRLGQPWAEYRLEEGRDLRDDVLAPHRDLRLEIDGVDFVDLPDGSRFGVGTVRIWELDPPRQPEQPEPPDAA